MIRVKICGVTNLEDALTAAEAGADAIGLNFWPGTRRSVEVDTATAIAAALPAFVIRVGVFVDATLEEIERTVAAARLDVVQLHGSEPPELARAVSKRVIRAVRARTQADLEGLAVHGACALLVDAHVEGMPGGTGETANWALARGAARIAPVILAGGLDPGNVGAAIRAVRPYAVDVASGVERAVGRKDAAKVRAFVREARRAFEGLQ